MRKDGKIKGRGINVIIAGVGGQGNVLLSDLIGNAFVSKGYKVSVVDTYGVTQRGGSVASHLKVSRDMPYSSVTLQGKADVILGMEPVEALRALGEYGNDEVITIVNPRPVYPTGGTVYPNPGKVFEAIESLSKKTIYIKATETALHMKRPILTNIILLGALIGTDILPIDKESMIRVLEDRFAANILDINKEAFNIGMKMGSGGMMSI